MPGIRISFGQGSPGKVGRDVGIAEVINDADQAILSERQRQ